MRVLRLLVIFLGFIDVGCGNVPLTTGIPWTPVPPMIRTSGFVDAIAFVIS